MKLEEWNPKPCSCEQIEGFDVSLSSIYSGRVIVTISKETPYFGSNTIEKVCIEIKTELPYIKEVIKKFVDESCDWV